MIQKFFEMGTFRMEAHYSPVASIDPHRFPAQSKQKANRETKADNCCVLKQFTAKTKQKITHHETIKSDGL